MLSLISLATSFTGLNMPTITYGGLINSPLAHHLIDHEILHVFFSLAKGPRKTRLTRAQRRKSINRRRRWFTDNIIMHHRRLQEINRQKLISSTRERALARKKNLLNRSLQKSKPKARPEINRTWQNGLSMRDRGLKIRGSVDTRKIRVRSRWLTVTNKKEPT